MGSQRNLFPTVMIASALVSGAATGILAAVYVLWPRKWMLPLGIACGTTFYHFAMRLLVGAVVPLFAGSFHPVGAWFRQRSWVPRLYALLKLKSRKNGIPTYDPGQFDLTRNSLSQVVRNMCCAEAVHEVIILLSFIPLVFAIPFGEFPVFFITSILSAGFDSIFVILQRFNRPRLVKILKNKEAKGL